jgi:hypothetical protein
MNWKAIKINSVLEILREIEKRTPTLTPTQSIVYSDECEELTITYRRLKDKQEAGEK